MIRIECIEGVYSRDIFELQISASPWSHGRSFETKQRSLCHKIKFSKPYIFVQTSDGTKVGEYKRLTYKCRTGTNVGLEQTSDWYKRRTGTYVGLGQMSN